MSTKKQSNNLPALAPGYQTFILPVSDDGLAELPTEVAAEIPDDDSEFYEAARGGLPFISIRQKELKDDKGKAIYPEGGFKYQNTDLVVPDADGNMGLVVSIMADPVSYTHLTLPTTPYV